VHIYTERERQTFILPLLPNWTIHYWKTENEYWWWWLCLLKNIRPINRSKTDPIPIRRLLFIWSVAPPFSFPNVLYWDWSLFSTWLTLARVHFRMTKSVCAHTDEYNNNEGRQLLSRSSNKQKKKKTRRMSKWVRLPVERSNCIW
jgi:hypothetical protein